MFSYSKFTHNYTKSVFNHTQPISSEFRVFVNGEEVPVYSCHISKYSFNCVWPGHQRCLDQYEEASFINLVSDEAIKIEVELLKPPAGRVRVKPYSKNIDVTSENGRYTFQIKENGQYVLQVGSYHKTLYIFNNKPVLCEEPSKVTHYFGPGIHFAGKIVLHSNESVYVDKDAYVYGCIYAENAENIRVFGNGIFDDGTEERVSIHCYEPFANGNIKFYECKNIKIEGVGFTDSAIWCVNVFGCHDVEIDGIRVFGQWRYNTDGIDIVNSQNVFIKNSFIHSFDDTITVKGIDRYVHIDCKNIHTENCVLWCDWGKACEIGIETACTEYENISFVNCDVLRGGDNVCDIQNGDTAEVHNIRFENIRAEYNSFDTPLVYQANDSQKYDKENEQYTPNLISVRNHPFRTERNSSEWGVPLEHAEVDLSRVKPGSVHDVIFKNISVYYDDDLYLKNGKPDIRVRIVKTREDTEFYNISVEDIKVNGKAFDFIINDN